MTDRTRPQPSAEDDLTAEFWGSSPDWQASRRNHLSRPSDRTGQIERTRTHGGDGSGPVGRMRMHGTDRTGAVERTRAHGADAEPAPRPPILRDEREETAAVVRSVFRPVEERPHHPRRSVAPRLVDARRVDVELQPRRPVEALADRLGIGAVDPLLLRLGVVVLIGVLLVPFALSLRGSSDPGDAELMAISADDPGESGAAVAVSEPVAAAAPAGDAAEGALTTAVVPTTAGSAPTAAGTSAAPPSTARATAATDSVGEVTQRGAYTMAATAEAEPDSAVAEPQCAAVYVVSSGDYWLRLADGAGVSLGDLLAANAASADTALYPGSEVCLPAGARMPSPPTTDAPTTAPPAVAAPTTAPATTNPATATTAAPTTVAPTTTAAPATAVAPSQVQALIREIWPDDLEEKALDVAYRESRYVATAYNGWCCYGVFQIHWTAHKGWLAGIGVTSAQQLFDARTNIELAYAIYVRAGGWAPWGG